MIWALLILLAASGWIVAGFLWALRRRYATMAGLVTKAVLINSAGLPESMRHLKGVPPKTYYRPRSGGPATEYRPIGHAVVYQATSPRQPQ